MKLLAKVNNALSILFALLLISCERFDDPILRERHNLFDYTVGQSIIAQEYFIPVLDLYHKSGITIENKDSFIAPDNLHYSEKGYSYISDLTKDFIFENGGFSDYTGKTVGIFGGSFSSIEASKACKNVWTEELGLTYIDYGKNRAGFSTLTESPIHSQVDEASILDIYIIWCSTNDCTENTPIDSVNSEDPRSQSFGMRKTIDKLLNKNPLGVILIFNSTKAYKYDYLYDPNVERY